MIMPSVKDASAKFEDIMKKINIDKRYITSVVYVVVLVLLLVLKKFVPVWGALGFDALFCAISIIGCIEFFNAVKVVPFQQRVVTVSRCALMIPMFILFEMIGFGGYIPVAVIFGLYALILVLFGIISLNGSNLKTTLLSLCAAVYCGILSCIFVAVNHLSVNSSPLILLMFLIVMLTDSFAYVFGKLFHRWVPYKLAPKISPNKTIIGGLGGVIGGMLAGVITYYLWFAMTSNVNDTLIYSLKIPAAVTFMLIGFVGAILGQAGDLVESYLKRRCDIKDSGKILPGHGGVLDRFDSMLFVGVLVFASSFILVL